MIHLGTMWRSFRSPTVLQAQTLVLRAGVDVVEMDESVAVDGGNHAADGVDNAAVSAAAAQGTGADVGDSNCHAAAAAVQLPRGPTAAAVQPPRRGNRCHPSVDRHLPRHDFAENHQRQAHGGRAAVAPPLNAVAVSSAPSLCGWHTMCEWYALRILV